MSKSLTKEYDFRGNVKFVDYQGFSKFKNLSTYIVVSAKRDEANAALESLGWPGPNNFNVQLKTGVPQIVTHYACSVRLNDVQKAEWDAALGPIAHEKHADKTLRQYEQGSSRTIARPPRP